jgi:hypothetical protein
MDRNRDGAVEEFLAAFDRRLEAAPVVERRDRTERRAHHGACSVDGRRAKGPVNDDFAYWDSKPDPSD